MSYKILVALDLSKLSKDVAAYASELALKLGAETAFLHVIPEPENVLRGYSVPIPATFGATMKEVRQTAERKLRVYTEDFCAKHPEGAPKCDINVEIGNPAQCIVEFAKNNSFDMIILGFVGHTAIDEFLVGSTASKVARYAPCSVLIYRPDKN